MVTGFWQLGLLVGLFAGNAVIVYRMYRLRERGTDTGADATDLVDPDAGTVVCPDCGTENELGYRYCRSCVSELPATMDFERNADSPLGRSTR